MTTEFALSLDTSRPDTVVVAVSGEVDLFTAPEFKAGVAKATGLARETRVVDFGRTTFIDSSSLGVLIGAHRRQTRRGASMVVVCERPAILSVFRMTGLDSVFVVVASIDDALVLHPA